MQKSLIALSLTFLVLAGPPAALADTEAKEAYEAGKAAFKAAKFQQARDLFLKAAGTDARNPDVWLWLGKAHYQLGAVAEAMAAWQRTLELAPGEVYARKMLDALRGEVVDPKARLTLIEQLLREKLYAAALAECTRLAAHKPLDDSMRAGVLICQGEALVGLGKSVDGYVAVQRALLRYPKQADHARGKLLMARVKLTQGGKHAARAVAALQALAADKTNKAVAAAAEYELIAFRLAQGITVGRVAALAKWVADNPAHRVAPDARQTIFTSYLAMARWPGKPGPKTALSKWDHAALAAAAGLYEHIASEKEAQEIVTQPVLKHAETYYAAAKAYPAAIAMVEALLKAELPRSSRDLAVSSLAGYKSAAAAAEYELITFELRQGTTVARVEALAKWVAQNPTHRLARDARRTVFGSYLVMARWPGKPGPKTALGKWDHAALAGAAGLYEHIASEKDAQEIVTQPVLSHAATYYAAHKAYRAAAAMVEGLLKGPMPRSSRYLALSSLAGYKTELAFEQLTREAKAGKLAGAVPEAIKAVLAVYDEMEKTAPGTSTLDLRTVLAARVRGLAGLMPWPGKAAERTTPYRWSVDIVLAAVKASTDESQRARAVAAVTAVIGEAAAKFQQKDVRGFALALSDRLLAALPADSDLRKGPMLQRVELLNVHALAEFSDNVKDGQREKNAALTAQQKALIATVGQMVDRKWLTPAGAVARLQSHLAPWISAGHYKAGEEACELLRKALPAAQRRLARLVVVTYWIEQATREHRRLQSAGLTVPRKLDAGLAKALVECYVLQAGLEKGDAFAGRIRGVWAGVIGHYKTLKYYDIAAEAAAVVPDKPVDAPRAYAYAQCVQADLKYEHAHRELARLLKNHKAGDELKLTEDFKAALAAYKKFLADRPTDPMAAHAVGRIFETGQVFERHKSFDVAAGIYQDFAAFAAKIKPLSQASPDTAGVAEQARFAVARTLNAKADHALAKLLADRKPEAPAPTKLTQEFAAAIESYKGFMADYPRSVLTSTAIRNIKTVALTYVRADAWSVAGGIYADLLKSGLKIDRPERMELLRGLCELGKAMPTYARGVITSLTVPPRPTKPKGPKTQPARRPGTSDNARLAMVVNGKDLSDALRKLRGRHAKAAPKSGFGTAAAASEGSGRGGGKSMAAGDAARLEEKAADKFLRDGDTIVLAALRRQEQSRSTRIARLRERLAYRPVGKSKTVVRRKQPILSKAELLRQEKAISAAYEIFQGIRTKYAKTPTADRARGEIMVMIGHWRTVQQWQRAAELARRFLKDNPTDREVPQIRLAIARDYLALASRPVKGKPSKQEMLAEVARRFEEARAELRTIVKDFSKDNKPLGQQAQWDIAQSFLTQARVVDAFSQTLARGQFVRAARELQAVAKAYHDHPKISQIPGMLWSVATELSSRAYHDEAIIVWNDLTIHYPTHAYAQQASIRIAETYNRNLRRPLRAAETYLEINHARGGSDVKVQNTIYQIGAQLKSQKRWIEALHVLETFVDSFPRHAQAGQALAMVGQIHQANKAWQDAIVAYERVINEFAAGAWVSQAKWSVAECRINLSQWRTAMRAYRDFAGAYPKDKRLVEATKRISTLKDLARYQDLVDEKGQRKAFDAQYQIARIVKESLDNPVKSIIEYRKVAENWPKSHLADDALYNVGTTYLSMKEVDKGREALLELAKRYAGSPLADDALFLVGKSYEAESGELAGVTRTTSLAKNKELAQRFAYADAAAGRKKQRDTVLARIAEHKRAGRMEMAGQELARGAAQYAQFNIASAAAMLQKAQRQVEALTATQLADRQDKINAALRKAVGAYRDASQVASADKAGDALLRMATIYDKQLKDPKKAMATWEEIVRQFSGTSVAEDASWRIAQYYEHHAKYDKALDAYKAFLRNYRRSTRAGAAQFAVAECCEHLNQWVQAMDAYTNYIKNFPTGPMVSKAKEQIGWIKTYRL